MMGTDRKGVRETPLLPKRYAQLRGLLFGSKLSAFPKLESARGSLDLAKMQICSRGRLRGSSSTQLPGDACPAEDHT